MSKKLFSLLFIAFLFLGFSSIPVQAQTQTSQSLGDVFNFFNVNCLVPDGTQTLAKGTSPSNLPFKVKACAKGGASLLDQAIGFLYNLGPILAVVVVMWGGYLYYNSVFGGDVAAAEKAVRAGITGLGIVLLVPILYGVVTDLSDTSGNTSSLFTRLTSTLVNSIIAPLANIGLVLGAAVAVLSFIFAGYQYLLGDSKKGQEALKNAFIGLVVVLASVAIVALIQVTVRLFNIT